MKEQHAPTYKRWEEKGRIFYSETTPPGVTIQIAEGDGISRSQSYHIEISVAQEEYAKAVPGTPKEEIRKTIFERSAKEAIGFYKRKVVAEAFNKRKSTD